VGKDHATNVAVRVDAAREIEPVFQRFLPESVALKERTVILESWV
jgi:hypothetical protein